MDDPLKKVFSLAQITSNDIFDEYCVKSGGSICIVTFLPHVLDVTPEVRKEQVQMIEDVRKKFIGKPFNFLWSQGGDQFDWEESMNLGFGYPAVVAITVAKKKFATMRSSWSKEKLISFVNGLAMNKEYFSDMRELPKLKKATLWKAEDKSEKVDL